MRKLFNLNRCDVIQDVVMSEGIIVSPNGAVFGIPEKTQGARDEKGHRQGEHKALYLGDGKVFYDTESRCTFVDDELTRLVQYKKIGENIVKCLDCEIKSGKVVGSFYALANGERYEGTVSSDGSFTGKCLTPASNRWYMNGLRHGEQKEWTFYGGEVVTVKKNYNHGYLDGEFSISGKTLYQYGYIKNGTIVFEKEVDFDCYPILKKLSLVGTLGALMTYGERKILRHTLSNIDEKSYYRR
ncbi:MAG: hypothetical protein IKV03_00655 [Alphaproteobacteria bacterium]|nr:hypothetical protein [Alphaproteobacteria bacterium]